MEGTFAGHRNVVVFSEVANKELELLLQKLFEIYPSRFFVVTIEHGKGNKNKSSKSWKDRIASECVYSPGREFCSLVYRLSGSYEEIDYIVSILRSRFLPGVSSELFLIDFEDCPDHVLVKLSELVDTIVFDGSRVSTISHRKWVASLCDYPVDLDWIQLEPWRMGLVSIFNIIGKGLAVTNPAIVSALCSSKFISKTRAILMAGWVLSIYGFHVRTFDGSVFECVSMKNHSQLLLEIKETNSDYKEVETLVGLNIKYEGMKIELSYENDNIVAHSEVKGITDEIRIPAKEENIQGPIEKLIYFGFVSSFYYEALGTGVDLERLANEYN